MSKPFAHRGFPKVSFLRLKTCQTKQPTRPYIPKIKPINSM